jgi:GAF domain-containing protein
VEIMGEGEKTPKRAWSAGANRPVDSHGRALPRFERLVEKIATGDPRLLADRLSQAVTDVLAVDGTAISVHLGANVAVPVGASNQEAVTAESLQFTLLEGPCLQSYTRGDPVLIADTHDPRSPAWTLWPTYTAELSRHTTYRGVSAFPLVSEGVAMGSLSLYRHHPGRLAEVEAITTIATHVAELLMDAQMFASRHHESEQQWSNSPTAQRRHQVWRAQGMTMQGSNLSPAQALDLLRAHAYTAGRLLDDVADDIVAGRLPVPILDSNL